MLTDNKNLSTTALCTEPMNSVLSEFMLIYIYIYIYIILDKDDCISYSTNTLVKGLNPIILLPVIEGRLGSLTSVRQPI